MAHHRFRSIWISDLHLGMRNLQSEQLLDFLLRTESQFLYLVGDILDLVEARRGWYWPAVNDRIVAAILAKAEQGTRVIYIPGNHDHILRKFHGCSFNKIRIQNKAIHEAADGKRYLVLHGDAFDPVVRHCPWLAAKGSAVYALLLQCNRWFKINRTVQERDNRSLSAWLKHQTKLIVNFIGRFDAVVAKEAADQQVDGLICGHIHRAGIREIDSVLYTNTGDWVESCTALAEHQSGRLSVIEWRKQGLLPEEAAHYSHEDLYRNRCLASPN